MGWQRCAARLHAEIGKQRVLDTDTKNLAETLLLAAARRVGRRVLGSAVLCSAPFPVTG